MLGLQPPEGRWFRAMALGAVDPWCCAAGRVQNALLHTFPSTTPPARAWAERHHLVVVGEPAAGCIPSVPVVGAGSFCHVDAAAINYIHIVTTGKQHLD